MLLILYRNKCNFETTKSSCYIFQFYVDCSSSSNKKSIKCTQNLLFLALHGVPSKKGGLLKRWENILCKFSGYHQLGQPPSRKKERRNSQIQLFRVQNRDGTLLFFTVQHSMTRQLMVFNHLRFWLNTFYLFGFNLSFGKVSSFVKVSSLT